MSSTAFKLNNKIFQAGAGAGKTTRLVSEVYDYYCFYKKTNLSDPKIVLTTFTRKATQELRERLMLFATLKEDDSFLNFVLSKNKLQITTMHGLLQIFLKQYVYLLGFDPSFKIIDDRASYVKSKSLLKDILSANEEYIELLEEFTFKQLTSVVSKISNLKLEYQAKGEAIAFADIQDFKKIKKDFLSQISIDLNAVSLAIVNEAVDVKWRDFGATLTQISNNFEKNLDINNLQERLEQIKKPSFSSKTLPISAITNETYQDLKKKISNFDPNQFNESFWAEDQKIYSKLDVVSSLFSERTYSYKQESGFISIQDIEILSLKLLNEYPNETSSFGRMFHYWFIDEYQDTSPIQVEILNKIIINTPRFVVGDPQQSIYFFRGAREEVFADGIKSILSIGGEHGVLNTNYRTQKPLMSFLNHFFENYSKKFTPMSIGNEKSSGSESINFYFSETSELQCRNIVSYVQNILSKKNVKPGDIAIIARKNDQLKAISEKLNKEGVPFVLHSASGFQERREIIDALVILKFLVVPFDNANLIALLRTPWFRLTDEKIISLVKDIKNDFWPELYNKVLSNLDEYPQLASLKKYLDMTYEIGITATFEKILFQRGFFELSQKYDSSGKRESNLWKLIGMLRQKDHQPGFNFLNFIEGYSEAFDTETDSDDSDAVSSLEPNRVNLLTVHMSKGLEFPHVIVPYFNQKPQLTNYKAFVFDEDKKKWTLNIKGARDSAASNLFSGSVLSKIKNYEESENDRLLYVTLTRAKESLALFTAGTVEKKSWMERSGLDLSLGEHKFLDFKYNVLSEEGEAFSAYSVSKKETHHRPKYQSQFLSTAPQKSVTGKQKEKKNFKIPTIEAAIRGTEIHKIFECLKYDTQDIFLENNASLKKSFDTCIEYINSTPVPFKEILKEGFAEWGFIHKTDAEQIVGQIDLWAKVDKTVWIIDYKTGSPIFKDSAMEQLRVYASALSNFCKDFEKINLVALYPFDKKFFLENYKPQ